MKKTVTNIPASVKAHLLTRARTRGEDMNILLDKYALERLLFRVSQSPHKETFVLKGSLLFELWTNKTHRPTKDADFLGCGDNDPAHLAAIFRGICVEPVEDDGLFFDPRSVKAQRINEEANYEGVRITMLAYLAKAYIKVQADIGFGDVVTPKPVELEYPTLLHSPAPRLLTCPKETVVAEKFEALVKLEEHNSRMKDFYDLRALATLFDFKGETLSRAIVNTFEHRQTALPIGQMPAALTSRFYNNPLIVPQWAHFIAKNRSYIEFAPLAEVMGVIKGFLMPLVTEVGRTGRFTKSWQPGGPWSGD